MLEQLQRLLGAPPAPDIAARAVAQMETDLAQTTAEELAAIEVIGAEQVASVEAGRAHNASKAQRQLSEIRTRREWQESTLRALRARHAQALQAEQAGDVTSRWKAAEAIGNRFRAAANATNDAAQTFAKCYANTLSLSTEFHAALPGKDADLQNQSMLAHAEIEKLVKIELKRLRVSFASNFSPWPVHDEPPFAEKIEQLTRFFLSQRPQERA